MLKEHKIKLLLVILLCLCLSQLVLGQNNLSGQSAGSVALQTSAAALPNPQEKSSLEALVVFAQFVQEEPLLLMLCGMMLFVGATTLRRIMSRRREQTPKSIKTSA